MKIERLLALFCFIAVTLLAEPIKSDFKACYKKSSSSFVKIKKNRAVVVKRGLALLYSRRYLKGYLKRDPFLGLYLFRVSKEIEPVRIKPLKEAKRVVAVLNEKEYKLNSIKGYANGLNVSATLKYPASANSLVECVCCSSFGLTTGGKKFIDSDFILHFLNKKRVVYGESGLRFIQKNGKIYVKEKNPFFKGNRLMIGDEIVSIDGKKFDNVSLLSKYILFSKPGTTIKIVYKRGKRELFQKLKLQKRVRGGLLGETFLENLGIYMNYHLKITWVKKGSLGFKLGLKKGDILLKIGKKYIYNYREIKRVLSTNREKVLYLLFSRDDFQFFVHFEI